MKTENLQSQYDILLAGLLFAVSVFGMATAGLGDPSLLINLFLRVISGAGMACILFYLLTVTLFLNACANGADTEANQFKTTAKCLQWASMLISLAVIILLSII